jgi:hypothetical protein
LPLFFLIILPDMTLFIEVEDQIITILFKEAINVRWLSFYFKLSEKAFEMKFVAGKVVLIADVHYLIVKNLFVDSRC